MILPSMPVGYWLLQESHHWYVLKDAQSVFLRRLLDKDGQEKMFHYQEEAAEYAHKHNAAGLAYDQEVES